MVEVVAAPRPVSSDYAAVREMLDDTLRAVVNAWGDIFREPLVARIVEPPAAPNLGLLVMFDHEWLGPLPIEYEWKLTELMDGMLKLNRRLFVTVQWSAEVLRPPAHARYGFVLFSDTHTQPPIYPRILIFKPAFLRPSNFLRRKLGMPIPEGGQ